MHHSVQRGSPFKVAMKTRNKMESSLCHREPVRLALLLAGEVGQLVEQVVRRRVSLLGPLH